MKKTVIMNTCDLADPAFYVLGGIEQLAFQALGLGIGAVGIFGGSVPKGIILGRIGHIPGVAHFEGVSTLQIPEFSHRIGEDDTVIVADTALQFYMIPLEATG